MKLSVLIIARNEEELLPKCLDSLQGLGDEIIIGLDTRSVDGTRLIAEQYGAIVRDVEWPAGEKPDFAYVRNLVETFATGDYVYWQDADEILLKGHDLIRAIVDKGEEIAIRPRMCFDIDEYGEPVRTYGRQDLLHKKGSHTWAGYLHEWTNGPPGRIEEGIIIRQLPRPKDERHGDEYAALRANAHENLEERHLIYLARQHFYDGHIVDCLALCDMLLQRPAEWPIQRSHAAILKGDCLRLYHQDELARAAYIQAVVEWGAWAEPYYAVGKLHYDLGQWKEGAAWLRAACFFDAPLDYFADHSIYDWRRYDLLAVCLYRLGDPEAEKWGAIALRRRPQDERLQQNMQWYRRETEAAVMEV